MCFISIWMEIIYHAYIINYVIQKLSIACNKSVFVGGPEMTENGHNWRCLTINLKLDLYKYFYCLPPSPLIRFSVGRTWCDALSFYHHHGRLGPGDNIEVYGTNGIANKIGYQWRANLLYVPFKCVKSYNWTMPTIIYIYIYSYVVWQSSKNNIFLLLWHCKI